MSEEKALCLCGKALCFCIKFLKPSNLYASRKDQSCSRGGRSHRSLCQGTGRAEQGCGSQPEVTFQKVRGKVHPACPSPYCSKLKSLPVKQNKGKWYSPELCSSPGTAAHRGISHKTDTWGVEATKKILSESQSTFSKYFFSE